MLNGQDIQQALTQALDGLEDLLGSAAQAIMQAGVQGTP